MAKTLESIITFFRVSPVQQALVFGITTPIIIDDTWRAVESYSHNDMYNGCLSISHILLCVGYALFNEVIAIKKLNEYYQVKNLFVKHGWDERVIEPKSHSWCQRNAAQVASNDTGFGKLTKEYFNKKGYRWYHCMPDF